MYNSALYGLVPSLTWKLSLKRIELIVYVMCDVFMHDAIPYTFEILGVVTTEKDNFRFYLFYYGHRVWLVAVLFVTLLYFRRLFGWGKKRKGWKNHSRRPWEWKNLALEAMGREQIKQNSMDSEREQYK